MRWQYVAGAAVVLGLVLLLALKNRKVAESVAPEPPGPVVSTVSSARSHQASAAAGFRGVLLLGAAEAVVMVGQQLGVPTRVAEAPPTQVTLVFSNDPPQKLLVKLADGLGLPLVAAQEGETIKAITQLTLTAGALIVGPTTASLEGSLNRLASADAEVRREAINQLESAADERLEAVFVRRMLNDLDPVVRGEAAAALGTATRPASWTALVRALQDEESWVVDNARTAIQQLGSERMEKYLRTELAAANPADRIEAADLLERVFGLSVPPEVWDEASQPKN